MAKLGGSIKALALLLTPLMASALAACATGLQRPPVVTAPIPLAERYERVALRGDDGSRSAEVARFEEPIRWYTVAEPAIEAQFRPFIAAHMADLGRLTGLHTQEAGDDYTNFVIVMLAGR